MFPMDPLTSWLFIALALMSIMLLTWASIEASRDIETEDKTSESIGEPSSPRNEEVYDWSRSGL